MAIFGVLENIFGVLEAIFGVLETRFWFLEVRLQVLETRGLDGPTGHFLRLYEQIYLFFVAVNSVSINIFWHGVL